MTVLPLTLWKTSVRYVFRSYVYLSLSVIGIAIGVAVVVAVDLSSATTSRQLRSSTQAILGSSSHHIVSGPEGVAEALYADIRSEGIPHLKTAPIVEGVARIENSRYVVTLLGVDPFAEMSFRTFSPMAGVDDAKTLIDFLTEPKTAIVAGNFLGLPDPLMIDDHVLLNVAGEVTRLRVVGLITDRLLADQAGLEFIVFTDISTAQELLGNFGFLTRIDVRFEGGVQNQDLGSVTKVLPESAIIVPSGLRRDALEDVTKAFELNLTALSFLSLMVGVFLIYNTMSFSVVRRRTTVGLLRAIGVTRVQILLLFFGEAIVFAVVSSVLGLLIGIGLAQVLLNITVRTLSDLFVTSNAFQIDLAPFILLKGLGVGLVATTTAAVVPAYEATTGSSLRAIRTSSAETAFRNNLGRMSALGGFAFLGGIFILNLPHEGVFISLIALALVTVGMSLQIPTCMAVLSKGLVALLRGRAPVTLFAAIRSIEASLSRTAIAVCALSLAVAVTIGIGLMIGSFRTTVEYWLDTSLDADVYISPPPITSSTLNGTLDPALVDLIGEQPAILEMTKLYTTQLETPAGPLQIAVVDASEQILTTSTDLKKAVEGVWSKFESTESVVVSESYALHNKVFVGQSLSLPTVDGPFNFEIVGIYRDYSSTRGVVMIHRAVYDLHWTGRRTSSIAIYLEGGVAVGDFVQTLYEISLPYQHLQIRDSRDLYATSLEVFDRTFEITSVLRAITIIVACIGVLSALVAHQIERAREGMVFRAIGLTPGQHKSLIVIQGLLLGAYAGLLAMPLGIVISWFLVNIINRRSFGWEMDLQLQWLVVGEGFLVAIGAAAVAGLYPALRRQGSQSVAEMSRDL